ncbi:hypothetical protein IJ117_01860 [Candidatus Saccharibacteria bacterium]|nr:hypothetical protein [Candidatus Saccharibacteria bacterium]
MAKAAAKKKATSAHRKVQASTTRSRKTVKKTVDEKIIDEKVVDKKTTDKQPVNKKSTVKKTNNNKKTTNKTSTPKSLETEKKQQEPEIILHTAKRVDLLEKEIEQKAAESTAETIFVRKVEKIIPTAEKEEPTAKEKTVDEPVSAKTETEVLTEIQQVLPSDSFDLAEVNARMEQRRAENSTKQNRETKTAKEIKETAIDKALVEASRDAKKRDAERRKTRKVHFGFRRVVLALACAAAAVFAIVYFVDLNTPNISLKVAAMQSGIDAKYPTYIPRDFDLSDITSENGKITLNFRNASTGDAFTIIEEKSSIDSAALLSSYVKPTYGDNYSEIVEQGLTLYISGSDAAWVNGGVLYKLKTVSGSLTKKQLKSIAVSSL